MRVAVSGQNRFKFSTTHIRRNQIVAVGVCPCGCGKTVWFGRKFATSGCANRGKKLRLSGKERKARAERMRLCRRDYAFNQKLLLATKVKPYMIERNKRLDIRRKVSLHRRGKCAGEDHPFFNKSRPNPKVRGALNYNWKGGGRSKYPGSFSSALKRRVKARDAGRCRKCGNKSGAVARLEVHHLDFDRKNNKMKNLLTVCSACHAKLHRGRKP